MSKYIYTKFLEHLDNTKINIFLDEKTFEEDDDYIFLAYYGKDNVGSLRMEVLYDAYGYEFKGDISEDEYNRMFSDETVVKIEYLKVEKEFRNNDIANKLMIFGMKYMKEQGYNQFYLNASPQYDSSLQLPNLITFYEKFGFKVFLHQGNNAMMYYVNKKEMLPIVESSKEDDEDLVPFELIPQYLYHISPIENKNSILKNGIMLKTGGTTYLNRTYNPRIYLCTSLIAAYDLSVNFNAHNNKEYKIYKISTDKLNTYEFYNDEKFAHGVYTIKNIDKDNIIAVINPNTLNYTDVELDNLYNNDWLHYDENDMNESKKKIGDKPPITNVYQYSKMLKRKGYVVVDGAYHLEILLRGDGDETDRAYDVVVPDYNDVLKQNRIDIKNGEDVDVLRASDFELYDTVLLGHNDLTGDTREIFYSEIEDILLDLNVYTRRKSTIHSNGRY